MYVNVQHLHVHARAIISESLVRTLASIGAGGWPAFKPGQGLKLGRDIHVSTCVQVDQKFVLFREKNKI